MRFAAPEWLWLLLALPPWLALLSYLAIRQARRESRLIAPHNRARVVLVRWPRLVWLRLGLVALAWIAASLAMARPQWGLSEETIRTEGLDLVLAIDASRSMAAEDVAPSRLELARAIASRLAAALPGDRIGLVAFAGSALRLCPLTVDRGALELYLDVLGPDLIGDQGTDLGGAIDVAVDLFDEPAAARKLLVLISDGEDHQETLEAALKRAAEAGLTIYTVGIGSQAGSPIPRRDGQGALLGYHTDREGQTVTTRLVEDSLRSISGQGGGAYWRVESAAGAVVEIAEQLSRLERTAREERLPNRRVERYRIPLAAALILLVLEAALVAPRREPR